MMRDMVGVICVGLLIMAMPASLRGADEKAQPAAPQAVATKSLKGHGETVYAVAFSPDGALLATASFDKTVKLWSVKEAKEIATLQGHASKVLSLAFSPDGATLLTGGEDKTVKLWSLPQASPTRVAGHTAAVRTLLATADGRSLVSGGDDGTVRVWNRVSLKEELKIENLGAPVLSIALDAAAEKLAAGLQSGAVRVFALRPPPATSTGGAVELVKVGEAWKHLKGNAAPPAEWAKNGFDDNGWASGESGFGYSSTESELATVKTKLADMMGGYVSLYARKVFQIADPKRVEKLTLKVVIDDGFVAYLNGQEVGRENVEGAPPSNTQVSAASAEPKEAVLDLTPHIAKLAAGANVLAVQAHNHSLASSDFVVTPSLSAVVKSDDTPKSEAVKPGAEIARLEGPTSPARALKFFDAATLGAIGDDGAARVWTVAEKKEAPAAPPQLEALKALAQAAAAKPVIKADGAEYSFDTNDLTVARGGAAQNLKTLSGHGEMVHTVAFSPDGALAASGSADKTVRIWNLADGKEVRSIAAHASSVYAVAFSPDGKQIASGGMDKIVKIWNVADGAEVKKLEGHEEGIFCIAFVDEGKALLTGSSDRSIRKWHIGDGKAVHTFLGHQGWVIGLAPFAPKNRIFSGDYAGNLLVWEPEKGQSLFAQKLPPVLHGLALSKDGAWVAVAKEDGTAELIEAPAALRN